MTQPLNCEACNYKGTALMWKLVVRDSAAHSETNIPCYDCLKEEIGQLVEAHDDFTVHCEDMLRTVTVTI